MKIGMVEKLVPNLKDRKTYVGTHQKSESSTEAWVEIEKGRSGYKIRTKLLDEALMYVCMYSFF